MAGPSGLPGVPGASNIKIPKSVLDMKFMKKTKDRLQMESDNVKIHSTLYANEITDEMRNATTNFISESSFIYCAPMIEGRVSYNGMNPEIEELMEEENEKSQTPSGEMIKDVSDEVLAKKIETYSIFNKRKRPLLKGLTRLDVSQNRRNKPPARMGKDVPQSSIKWHMSSEESNAPLYKRQWLVPKAGTSAPHASKNWPQPSAETDVHHYKRKWPWPNATDVPHNKRNKD